jgi:hypothetical protein
MEHSKNKLACETLEDIILFATISTVLLLIIAYWQ